MLIRFENIGVLTENFGMTITGDITKSWIYLDDNAVSIGDNYAFMGFAKYPGCQFLTFFRLFLRSNVADYR